MEAHVNKELIQHLSKEIEAHTTYLTTFRSRIAFSVLVGPFVVMGAVIVGAKGTIAAIHFDWWVAIGTAVAVLSYILLGFFGSQLDQHVTEQCNVWRRSILRVHRGESIQDSDLVFVHRNQALAYLCFIILMLIAFIAIASVISRWL